MTAHAKSVGHRHFPAGTVLIRQGDTGDCGWILESGEVEVALETPAGLKRLAILGPGALVGEMALIDAGVRSATVTALSDVAALELTGAMVRRHIEAGPPLASYLLSSLITAIRRAHGLWVEERNPKDGPVRSRRSFDRVLDRRGYSDGHVFFRQDDSATVAYLIQFGQVSIRRDDAELAVLGPGRIFGELALLRAQPRVATAVAVGQTTCEVIRREDFKHAISAMPPILRSLTRIYVEMLSNPLYLTLSARLNRTETPPEPPAETLP
ncbi:cyclic nucleotide-binding domain-containing protein [Azospirillum sp. TSO22-1]|uniref:cyclic nucleotide-binding domain-containing protein n=1 Tax=Azospirillum sp. TSO22-1 TaxID=716789 RepID=UPI001FFE995B|nr:cyclic nucleotide-binding domain-containing protein [Azospirillum sp. TSO22-1]